MIANRLPLFLFAVGAPVILFGVVQIRSNSSDVALWLPDDGPQRREYAEFVDRFGDDDFLFITWTDCQWDDPRIDRLADRLETVVPGTTPFFSRCVTGPEFVRRLDDEVPRLSRRRAMDRLQGILASRDRRLTGLMLQLTDHGRSRQYDAVDVALAAAQQCGVPRDDLRLGGSAFEAAMADAESYHSFRNEIPIIFIITSAIAWICFRDWRVAALALSLGAYSYFLAIALVYFTGGQMNAVLIAMPVLVYVLTLSGAVHLLNYYADVSAAGGSSSAGRRALAAGWLPCSLAVVSTALGLCSLSVSQLRPVREFGFYASIGLVVSLVVLLSVLPAALDAFPVAYRRWAHRYGRKRGDDAMASWQRAVAGFLLRRPNVTASVCLSAIFILGCGLPRLTSDVKLENLFREDTELIRNYRWLEERFGPLVPVEVMLHFKRTAAIDPLLQAELAAFVHARLRQQEAIGGIMSAATFLPVLPARHHTIERSQFRRQMEARRDELVRQRYLVDDDDETIWRVSARIPAVDQRDYAAFVDIIRGAVTAATDQWLGATAGQAAAEDVRIAYTGLLPMVHHAQQQLLTDLVKSFGLALLLILPVMAAALGSLLFGLAAMIPNVAPVAIVFGAMGWLDLPIDIGAMLTASVAMGIAIDDTLHYLTWFRRAAAQGMNPQAAVDFAFRKCSTAMIQTTIITSLGMLILVRSSYVPTSHFAVLMALMLSAALIGDLLLLPSLLASGWGRYFRSSQVGAQRVGAVRSTSDVSRLQ